LDPTRIEDLKKLNEAGPEMVRSGQQELVSFLKSFSATHEGFKAELFTYSHVPAFHGFALNDRYFYMAMPRPEEGSTREDGVPFRMRVDRVPFERMEFGLDQVSNEKIELFQAWHKYCQQRRVYPSESESTST